MVCGYPTIFTTLNNKTIHYIAALAAVAETMTLRVLKIK